MTSSVLATIAKWEIILFVCAIASIIAMRLLNGRINMRYLLYGTRKDGSRYFSPERVQLLVVTLGVAFQYLVSASHAPPAKMPNLPDGALQLLGVSNGVYLGGKAFAFTRNAANESENA